MKLQTLSTEHSRQCGECFCPSGSPQLQRMAEHRYPQVCARPALGARRRRGWVVDHPGRAGVHVRYGIHAAYVSAASHRPGSPPSGRTPDQLCLPRARAPDAGLHGSRSGQGLRAGPSVPTSVPMVFHIGPCADTVRTTQRNRGVRARREVNNRCSTTCATRPSSNRNLA